MQRASRLKRELQMLSTEPPPGITCWQTEERIDDLQARKSYFTQEINLQLQDSLSVIKSTLIAKMLH